MGINIDLDFAVGYQGLNAKTLRNWLLQNKDQSGLEGIIGNFEGGMKKSPFFAAHDGPWEQGKASILHPMKPRHFRSVVLKADEINRAFAELSSKNPDLLKIGSAEYVPGKSEGVALVGSLRPWQIHIPGSNSAGRILYEQQFYLRMRIATGTVHFSGKQIKIDNWELCFPVCGKNVTELLGDYSAGSLLRELQAHCQVRPDAKQSKAFAEWENGKEVTLEDWYNLGSRLKDRDVYAANLDAFWETWVKGNKSMGFNTFGYVFTRKKPVSKSSITPSTPQPSTPLVPNHRREDPGLWKTSRLQVNRMNEASAKGNGTGVLLLEYLESTIADSSTVSPQLSASYSLQRKVDLKQSKGIYAQCDSPSAAVSRAIDILGRQLAAKLHIQFSHVDKDGYHQPTVGAMEEIEKIDRMYECNLSLPWDGHKFRVMLNYSGTLGSEDEEIEKGQLCLRSRCKVSTILEMGLEYDANDMERYIITASCESTIEYTQIYYLQKEGAGISRPEDDVPVHARLSIGWKVRGDFKIDIHENGDILGVPSLVAEPLPGTVNSFMICKPGRLSGPLMHWMLQPLHRSPGVMQELVDELNEVWENIASEACSQLVNSEETNHLETLPPSCDFTKSTLIVDPNIKMASDTKVGLLGWFGSISAIKEDTHTVVFNGASQPKHVDSDQKPTPKPATVSGSSIIPGESKAAVSTESTIVRPPGEILEGTGKLHWKVSSVPPLIKAGQTASVTIQVINAGKSMQSVSYLMIGPRAVSGLFTDNKPGFNLNSWMVTASSKPQTESVLKNPGTGMWQLLKVSPFRIGSSEVIKFTMEGTAGTKGVYELQIVEVTLDATDRLVNKQLQLKIGVIA